MGHKDVEARRAYKAAYYIKNREKIRSRASAYGAAHREEKRSSDASRRRIPTVWIKAALGRARKRARKSRVEFDLMPEDLAFPNVCPFTLLPFEFNGASPQNPSIDRIKPDRGYVRGNVRIISMRANIAKSDITDPAIFDRLADDARLWSLV